ncbi:MAG: omptin family outer membrane protease [Spirochaetaceae bacterium]|jgi:outer membrane protease|nr:omptin family outer membrane protease [Spirochaetaceae bacterium]
MKTISGFIGLVIMFYLSFTLSAETEAVYTSFPYTFSLSSSAGLLAGRAEEIVYASSDSDERLSQLRWDIQPLFYAGMGLHFSRINPLEKWGIFADLSLRFGIPAKTGSMEDRDWQAEDGHLTNFSSHTNYTEGAFLLDFAPIGFSFPIFSLIVCKVYPVFSFMYFSWASKDGYIQYEQYNTDAYTSWEKRSYTGPVINYTQQWLIISQGIGVWAPFLKIFSASLAVQIGTAIQCIARDDHFLRNMRFIDTAYWGFYLEPKGEFVFAPHPRARIGLSAGYRLINGSRGASYTGSTGLDLPEEFTSSESTAGAGYGAFDIGLSVELRF